MGEFEAIVVGSGIGGLAAATKLSQGGHDVLLLEAGTDFGGYVQPLVYGHYTFDLGLHYLGKLGPGETFRKLLDDLGLEDLSFLELDPDGFDRYVFPDYEFRFCKGKELLADRLIRDFPSEERGVRRFLDITEKIGEAAEPRQMLKAGMLSWIPYLLRNPILIKYGQSTYQTVLDDITADKRLQSVLSAPLFDVALGPRRVSAVAALGVWALYLNGAYYPRGGSRALRDRFVGGLRQRGVEMISSAPVRSLSRKSGKWLVKTEQGDEYTGRIVISDVDPTVTIGALLDRDLVPKQVFRKAANLRPSPSIISVFIGTDLDLPSLGIGTENISQFSRWDLSPYYDGWVDGAETNYREGFFMNSPSVRDPEGGFAPEGHHTLQILTGGNFGNFEQWKGQKDGQRGGEYEEVKRTIEEDMVEKAERYVPGLSGHLTFIDCVTPLDCVDRVRAVRGGIYGPEQSPEQMGPGRFPGLGCGVDGLFLAGAGTFCCGLLHCAASGAFAAEKAMVFLRR